MDHTKCHNTEPKAGVSALIWAPWAHFVLTSVPSTDVQGNLYAVRDTPLTGGASVTGQIAMPVGTVPCIPYKRLFADKLNWRMADSLGPFHPTGNF